MILNSIILHDRINNSTHRYIYKFRGFCETLLFFMVAGKKNSSVKPPRRPPAAACPARPGPASFATASPRTTSSSFLKLSYQYSFSCKTMKKNMSVAWRGGVGWGGVWRGVAAWYDHYCCVSTSGALGKSRTFDFLFIHKKA